MSSCSCKFLLHWRVVGDCRRELEESSWVMSYLTFITHKTQAAASPSSVWCETLWAMLTEEAWSNHWLLILRKVRPLSLPSNAMDRAFFKLLSGGRPRASHLDISIKQGSVWICVCTGPLGAQGEGKHGDLGWRWGWGSPGKGSRGILLLWKKETCCQALQWGQEVSSQNRSSTLWLHTALHYPSPSSHRMDSHLPSSGGFCSW